MTSNNNRIESDKKGQLKRREKFYPVPWTEIQPHSRHLSLLKRTPGSNFIWFFEFSNYVISLGPDPKKWCVPVWIELNACLLSDRNWMKQKENEKG